PLHDALPIRGDESAAGEEVFDSCEIFVDSAHSQLLSSFRSRSSSTTLGPMTSRYLSYSEGTTRSLKACRCFLLGTMISVLPDSSMIRLASALTFCASTRLNSLASPAASLTAVCRSWGSSSYQRLFTVRI